MPVDSRSRPLRRAAQARGAILLESLVALALVSLLAAGTFIAFDRLEETSRTVRTLSADHRDQTRQAEAAGLR